MDIDAWQKLARSDPAAAQREFQRRCERLSPSQQRAVWAFIDQDPFGKGDRLHDAPLTGVPFAIKDLFYFAGAPTRAGSSFLSRTSRQECNLIVSLRQLGAVPVGTTHLHEFAYGLTGGNPHYGNVQHPHHLSLTSGGSSSGSAAVVAADIVPFALGTDTGGSLRVPAAYCGIFSWRDTPHHPWIQDAFPLAPSFDTAGWLTKSPQDLRRLHHLLINASVFSTGTPHGAYLSAQSLDVELPGNFEAVLAETTNRIAPTIAPAPSTFAAVLKDSAQPYSVLQSTEAFAVHQHHLDRRKAEFGEAVWQRIDRGRRWRADELTRAKVHHLKVKAAFNVFFRDFDYLVMPVAPTPALAHDDSNQANRDALLALTTPGSLAGLPIVTVPVPLGDGLSLGLQYIFPDRQCPAIDWLLRRCETSLPSNS